jgi:hypothetical protein
MKFSSMTMFSIKLIPISVMLAMGVTHAATTEPVAAATSGAVVKANPKVVTTGKGTSKVTTGTIAGKGDENQYPAGSIPVPPKPKKEGLEAAGAIKAKAAQP